AYHLLKAFNLGDEVFLSFLPLSHSYEHTAGQFFPISLGAQIYYAESVEHLMANMAVARPTIMTAVPRLYESMHMRITRAMAREPEWRRKLFERTIVLGRKAYETPDSLTLRERIENWLLNFIVRRKVQRRFGGRLKALVSGGAALNYEIGVF